MSTEVVIFRDTQPLQYAALAPRRCCVGVRASHALRIFFRLRLDRDAMQAMLAKGVSGAPVLNAAGKLARRVRGGAEHASVVLT